MQREAMTVRLDKSIDRRHSHAPAGGGSVERRVSNSRWKITDGHETAGYPHILKEAFEEHTDPHIKQKGKCQRCKF